MIIFNLNTIFYNWLMLPLFEYNGIISGNFSYKLLQCSEVIYSIFRIRSKCQYRTSILKFKIIFIGVFHLWSDSLQRKFSLYIKMSLRLNYGEIQYIFNFCITIKFSIKLLYHQRYLFGLIFSNGYIVIFIISIILYLLRIK